MYEIIMSWQGCCFFYYSILYNTVNFTFMPKLQTFKVFRKLVLLSEADYFIRMSLLSCQDGTSFSFIVSSGYVCELTLRVLACTDADRPLGWAKIPH